MSTGQRVTVPRDLHEKMMKVWALYEMGLLVPAAAGDPIKMPPRDSALPSPRHSPIPEEPPIVGTAPGAPNKLDASTPSILGLGLSAEWRPTNAAVRSENAAPA